MLLVEVIIQGELDGDRWLPWAEHRASLTALERSGDLSPKRQNRGSATPFRITFTTDNHGLCTEEQGSRITITNLKVKIYFLNGFSLICGNLRSSAVYAHFILSFFRVTP